MQSERARDRLMHLHQSACSIGEVFPWSVLLVFRNGEDKSEYRHLSALVILVHEMGFGRKGMFVDFVFGTMPIVRSPVQMEINEMILAGQATTGEPEIVVLVHGRSDLMARVRQGEHLLRFVLRREPKRWIELGNGVGRIDVDRRLSEATGSGKVLRPFRWILVGPTDLRRIDTRHGSWLAAERA